MTVRDLLPIIPRYADDSGYNVSIRYKSGVIDRYTHTYVSIHPDWPQYPFKNVDEILDEEVEQIGSGYMDDDCLQIYLATERFLMTREEYAAKFHNQRRK